MTAAYHSPGADFQLRIQVDERLPIADHFLRDSRPQFALVSKSAAAVKCDGVSRLQPGRWNRQRLPAVLAGLGEQFPGAGIDLPFPAEMIRKGLCVQDR